MTIDEKLREYALKLNPMVNLHFGPDSPDPWEKLADIGFDMPTQLALVVDIMGWDDAMKVPDVARFMRVLREIVADVQDETLSREGKW